MQSLYKDFLWYYGHAHALGRQGKPFIMLIRAEYIDSPILHAKSFHAFKNRLPIMQGQRGWAERKVPKWNNAHSLPIIIYIITNQHVVGLIFSEFQFIPVNFLYARAHC